MRHGEVQESLNVSRKQCQAPSRSWKAFWLLPRMGFPVILWLTKNMFILQRIPKSFLLWVTATPKCFQNHFLHSHDRLSSWQENYHAVRGLLISSDLDALDFHDQLGKYRDFSLRFRRLTNMNVLRCSISLCFLENNVLQDAEREIEFCFVMWLLRVHARGMHFQHSDAM